jgi:hypothetical protein
MIDEVCKCRTCKVELNDDNWYSSWKSRGNKKCIDCIKPEAREVARKINKTRMYVNGKYIPKSHPLYKAGNYKSFNDAAFSSLQNYTRTKEGCVYIITNPAWTGWVKIGMAVDAEDRLNGYQTGSPFRDYKVEYSIKCKDRRKSEKRAHTKALKKCGEAHGEWFKMSVGEAIELLDNLDG